MDHQLIQQIYTAGVQADRFEALLNSWEEKIFANGGLSESPTLGRPEIVSHIRQAVALCDDLDPERVCSTGVAEDPWMAGPYPVMLCDASGCVRESNPPAGDRYDAAHVAALPFEPDTIEGLRRAVARVAATVAGHPVMIPAKNTENQQLTVISVQRHRGPGVAEGDLVRLVSNELDWPHGLDDLLQKTFGLSQAECAVMRLMTEGASVARVAEQRGSSVPTVRVQVRAIYAKTGVRSQAEMLRLALSFVSLSDVVGKGSRSVEEDRTRRIRPASHERHLLVLPDGRRFDYADLGDTRGQPVLFLHDEYYGDYWSDEAIACAAARGLRIISPARAYFGRSDGYPAGVSAQEQLTRDLGILLSELGIERFAMVARRTGFRYGVEVAHRWPERVMGLVAASPALPRRSSSDYVHMTPLARFISFTIAENPALLELVCRAGIRYFKQKGPKKLAALLNKGSAADLAALEDPLCWQLIEAGMAFSSTHGYLGYLHDVRHDADRAWQRTIDCPVHMRCLIGSLDPNDRAQRARHCIDAGADMSVGTVEGAGQLFFLSHPMAVLDEIRAAVTGAAARV